MRSLALYPLVALALAAGCGKQAPLAPASGQGVAGGTRAAAVSNAAVPAPGRPGYEPAYVNGQTVTINAIEVPNVAPEKAQADFYEIVYPPNWQALGLAPPQCNPCDHQGNGIDMTDFHDHVLDSMPGAAGANDYRAPWHVYLILPALGDDDAHNALVNAAYATHVPVKSEDAVNDLLAARLDDGSPVAVKIDTDFYFLCAVVSPNASR